MNYLERFAELSGIAVTNLNALPSSETQGDAHLISRSIGTNQVDNKSNIPSSATSGGVNGGGGGGNIYSISTVGVPQSRSMDCVAQSMSIRPNNNTNQLLLDSTSIVNCVNTLSASSNRRSLLHFGPSRQAKWRFRSGAKKSFVWKYFFHPHLWQSGPPDLTHTQCTLCCSLLAFNTSGTTTTMLNHLKSRHRSVIDNELGGRSASTRTNAPARSHRNGDDRTALVEIKPLPDRQKRPRHQLTSRKTMPNQKPSLGGFKSGMLSSGERVQASPPKYHRQQHVTPNQQLDCSLCQLDASLNNNSSSSTYTTYKKSEPMPQSPTRAPNVLGDHLFRIDQLSKQNSNADTMNEQYRQIQPTHIFPPISTNFSVGQTLPTPNWPYHPDQLKFEYLRRASDEIFHPVSTTVSSSFLEDRKLEEANINNVNFDTHASCEPLDLTCHSRSREARKTASCSELDDSPLIVNNKCRLWSDSILAATSDEQIELGHLLTWRGVVQSQLNQMRHLMCEGTDSADSKCSMPIETINDNVFVDRNAVKQETQVVDEITTLSNADKPTGEGTASLSKNTDQAYRQFSYFLTFYLVSRMVPVELCDNPWFQQLASYFVSSPSVRDRPLQQTLNLSSSTLRADVLDRLADAAFNRALQSRLDNCIVRGIDGNSHPDGFIICIESWNYRASGRMANQSNLSSIQSSSGQDYRATLLELNVTIFDPNRQELASTFCCMDEIHHAANPTSYMYRSIARISSGIDKGSIPALLPIPIITNDPMTIQSLLSQMSVEWNSSAPLRQFVVIPCLASELSFAVEKVFKIPPISDLLHKIGCDVVSDDFDESDLCDHVSPSCTYFKKKLKRFYWILTKVNSIISVVDLSSEEQELLNQLRIMLKTIEANCRMDRFRFLSLSLYYPILVSIVRSLTATCKQLGWSTSPQQPSSTSVINQAVDLICQHLANLYSTSRSNHHLMRLAWFLDPRLNRPTSVTPSAEDVVHLCLSDVHLDVDQLSKELVVYQSELQPADNVGCDPLQWWLDKHDHLKHLSQLARQTLAIPLSCQSSEGRSPKRAITQLQLDPNQALFNQSLEAIVSGYNDRQSKEKESPIDISFRNHLRESAIAPRDLPNYALLWNYWDLTDLCDIVH